MTPFKFASWNGRGFRDKDKQKEVVTFAKQEGVDLLFVQEANFRTPLDVANFRREHQIEAFFSLTDTRSCGVGVIFVSGRFRQKAHCLFGSNGRILMVDIHIEGKKVRFVNVYAPVRRPDTNTFYKAIHAFLREPIPHVILGDFNCVIDSQRDIWGPGQGGSTYHSKELGKILRHLRLTDAWVYLHADLFEPTRTSRTTASRIDRIYLPDYLLPMLEACTVLMLPDGLKRKTDHLPVGQARSDVVEALERRRGAGGSTLRS
ncbi:hypothetical protein HPB52_023342 [Rhipicephalus sanguineus]|uniref:exodeoxyribonuclease III n=1 Tax=Rhipicephalus sanguineus TaxID=34632 RepID=A0A9D4T4I3_RHISA|nr:hypothetical protein HPB52_023342 [Rhipicephalus sanguineus]